MSKHITLIVFGDVVARLGRSTLAAVVPLWRKKYKPDLVVANVENLAHGRGVTLKTLDELQKIGIDAFTGGNHVWTKESPLELMQEHHLAVPANDPRTPIDKALVKVPCGDQALFVLNLQGTIFMNDDSVENPFLHFDKVVAGKPLPLLVDLHAEATSEKVAFGHYVDGRASLVVGTHTHIPTADAKILPKGTGYITDIGMTGSDDSVLGVNKEIIIKRFTGEAKEIFDYPEHGPAIANAILATIDMTTGHCTTIEHISHKLIIK